MKEIYTEITINATPERVWSILTDLEKYSEWNPFILESSGKAELGCRLTCRPRLPGRTRVHTFHPVVTRVKSNKEFAWKGHVGFPGLADGEHIFEIHPMEGGGVRHVHRQEFSGLLIPLIWKAMAKPTEAGFHLMNQALKEKAESAL